MTRHEVKEKKKTDVCKKGTKWRGREPMKPHLIREPMQTWLKMYALCVHLRRRRVPMDPKKSSAAATYAVPKWLAALTALVTYRHEPAWNSTIHQILANDYWPEPTLSAADYSGPGRRDDDKLPFNGSTGACSGPSPCLQFPVPVPCPKFAVPCPKRVPCPQFPAPTSSPTPGL